MRSLSPKVFVFDTDMDVSGGACLLVCRGEGAEVLQVWQLFCQEMVNKHWQMVNEIEDAFRKLSNLHVFLHHSNAAICNLVWC